MFDSIIDILRVNRALGAKKARAPRPGSSMVSASAETVAMPGSTVPDVTRKMEPRAGRVSGKAAGKAAETVVIPRKRGAYLELCSNQGERIVIESTSSSFAIGRDRAHADYLIDDPSVSMYHALVAWSDDDQAFFLRDLNSSNGTYINDGDIGTGNVRVCDGDVLRFGMFDECAYTATVHTS